jgi:hypothetical protein
MLNTYRGPQYTYKQTYKRNEGKELGIELIIELTVQNVGGNMSLSKNGNSSLNQVQEKKKRSLVKSLDFQLTFSGLLKPTENS